MGYFGDGSFADDGQNVIAQMFQFFLDGLGRPLGREAAKPVFGDLGEGWRSLGRDGILSRAPSLSDWVFTFPESLFDVGNG